MRRLTCTTGGSSKFWEAGVEGNELTVRFGRIGTDGQVKTKKLADAAAAKRELDKLIAEKLAKGYVDDRPKPKKKSSARLDALLGIGALLAPKSKSLAKKVTLAFEDPPAYVRADRKRLDERGIDEPVDELPWVALIDELTDAKVLVEIDWKTDAEDLDWAIGKLVKGFRVKDAERDERSTWELLELAGAQLRKKGFQLAQLDMGSDAFPLIVVPQEQLAELVRLGKAARYGDIDLFGDDLKEATRDRIAREKKYERDAAKERARKPPPWEFDGKGDAMWTIQTHALGFNTGYEAPGVKQHVYHYFKSREETRAAAKRHVEAWLADGFRKMTQAEHDAFPSAPTAYVGWTGPFPKHARYYLENKRIVRCVALRDDAVIITGGMVGGGFGELENCYHGKDVEKRFAEQVAQYDKTSFYKPIERDELIALYRKHKK